MAPLKEKIRKLVKCANLYRTGGYRHYVTGEMEMHFGVTEAPLFLQRAVMQTAFAWRMSEAAEGKYDELVSRVADNLIAAYENEGAISKAKAKEAEEMLLPLADAAKKYKVHMVAHAHIDMNWQWPYHETVAVTLETFRTVLKLMEEFPEFCFSQSQASVYKIVEEYESEMLDAIRRRVHEGRWEVSASTWVEADKNMPSSESMARHLLYTKNYLSKLLDISIDSMNLDYEPDTFGHSANVPEILNKSGVKYYYYCRGHEPTGAHIWRSKSGAQVLAYQEPTWYLGDVNPGFAMYVPKLCRDTGIMDSIKVYGVGDHGGGPTRQDLTYIEEMKTWPVFPTLVYSTYRAYFTELEKSAHILPVVDEELNCVFTGCYTTQSRIKYANRMGEAMLGEAEALSAAAKAVAGRNYRAKAFENGWTNILFSQFHDILTGSGVRDTREYAMAKFSETMAYAGTEYAAAMRAIVENIDTSFIEEKGADAFTRAEGAGVGYDSMRYRPPVAERCASLTRIFHIFNPTPFEKKGPCEVVVWDYPGEINNAAMRTLCGKPLTWQMISHGREGYMLHTYHKLLVDVTVPAWGWTSVILEDDENAPYPLKYPGDPRKHGPVEFILENEYLRAEFDTVTGMLVSLVDKTNGQEMLSAPCGFFDILEDSSKGMTSWYVGRYLRREPIAKDVYIDYCLNGELRSALRVKTKFATASTLEYTVSLDKGAKALTYDVKCDWHELGTKKGGMAQLAFAAPFRYPSAHTRYDIPAGIIDRPPMELDVPTNGLSCALNSAGGKALVLTSNAKYGFRTFDQTLQATLIRAGFDPDPDPEKGLHEFTVSLGVSDDVSGKALAEFSSACNRPAGFITARPHKGTLSGRDSFIGLSGDNAYIHSIKQAEDGNGMILRVVCFENAEFTIRALAKIKKAYASDVMENKLSALTVSDGNLTASGKAGELITLLLEM